VCLSTRRTETFKTRAPANQYTPIRLKPTGILTKTPKVISIPARLPSKTPNIHPNSLETLAYIDRNAQIYIYIYIYIPIRLKPARLPSKTPKTKKIERKSAKKHQKTFSTRAPAHKVTPKTKRRPRRNIDFPGPAIGRSPLQGQAGSPRPLARTTRNENEDETKPISR